MFTIAHDDTSYAAGWIPQSLPKGLATGETVTTLRWDSIVLRYKVTRIGARSRKGVPMPKPSQLPHCKLLNRQTYDERGHRGVVYRPYNDATRLWMSRKYTAISTSNTPLTLSTAGARKIGTSQPDRRLPIGMPPRNAQL